MLILLAYAAATAPQDWADLIASGDLLYSPTPVVTFSAPNIGNGFVAFQLGPTCNSSKEPNENGVESSIQCGLSGGVGDRQSFLGGMHMAGVFNGVAAETVSHRARMPAVQNIQVANSSSKSTLKLVGAAVDIRRALFLNRSVMSSTTCQVQIEQRIYAHQTYRNLVVHELVLNSSMESSMESGLDCVISLNHLDPDWASTDDFTFNIMTNTSDVVVVQGSTKLPEVTQMNKTEVGIAYQPLPQNIVVNHSGIQRLVHLLVAHSSLEPNTGSTTPWQQAASDLTHYSSKSPEALLTQHELVVNCAFCVTELCI